MCTVKKSLVPLNIISIRGFLNASSKLTNLSTIQLIHDNVTSATQKHFHHLLATQSDTLPMTIHSTGFPILLLRIGLSCRGGRWLVSPALFSFVHQTAGNSWPCHKSCGLRDEGRNKSGGSKRIVGDWRLGTPKYRKGYLLAIMLWRKFLLQRSPIISVACFSVSWDVAGVEILFTEGDLEVLDANAVDPITAKVRRIFFCDGETSSNLVTGDNRCLPTDAFKTPTRQMYPPKMALPMW